LREIAVEGLRARHDGGAGLDHHQSAIRERERHHRRVSRRLVWIEVSGRLPDAYAEGAAAIRLLGFRRRRVPVRKAFAVPETEDAGRGRGPAELEEVTTGRERHQA
jgi:hypothetical protein